MPKLFPALPNHWVGSTWSLPGPGATAFRKYDRKSPSFSRAKEVWTACVPSNISSKVRAIASAAPKSCRLSIRLFKSTASTISFRASAYLLMSRGHLQNASR